MTVSQNVIDAAGQAGIFLNGLLVSNRQARIKQEENRRRTGGDPFTFALKAPMA